MNSLKVVIVFILLTTLLITLSSAQPKHKDKKNDRTGKELGATIDSYRGSSRFFNAKKHHHDPYKSVYGGHNARAHLTCDNFPRVCHAKGSPGPDCCGKRCVNVKTDSLNCGMCGRRCRFPEVCCNGRCVNVRYDRKNCGACHNKCKRGSFCYYGMCSYA